MQRLHADQPGVEEGTRQPVDLLRNVFRIRDLGIVDEIAVFGDHDILTVDQSLHGGAGVAQTDCQILFRSRGRLSGSDPARLRVAVNSEAGHILPETLKKLTGIDVAVTGVHIAGADGTDARFRVGPADFLRGNFHHAGSQVE